MAKGHFKWVNTTNSITYNSWRSMRNRCLHDNANSQHYKQKGISICDEWSSFDQFVADMGERPEGTSLDRIDPAKGYFPDNCRWASWREQENNKPNLTSIEHNGEVHTIGEWAYILDLTDTELSKVYKRHAKYGAVTYEELFYPDNLLSKRVAERTNQCLICQRTESCKWRKFGTLCNNCYHKALRWSKRTNNDIELFDQWQNVPWPTDHQHISKPTTKDSNV